MLKLKHQHITNIMLSVSLFINMHSLATAGEEDIRGTDLQPFRIVHRDVTVEDLINLLKNNILIKFEAQKNHRNHVILYHSSRNQAQIAIKEVEGLMWNEMKEKSIRFFEIHSYESCYLKDVLFVGALHDIFEKCSTRDKAEQKDLLMMLEDSCKNRHFY